MRTIQFFFILLFFSLTNSHSQTYSAPSTSALAGKNVFLGVQAGRFAEQADMCTFVGFRAGGDVGTTLDPPIKNAGSHNTFVGAHSGDLNIGNYNSFFGSFTSNGARSGDNNSVFGYGAASGPTGSSNAIFGSNSRNNGGGSFNTIIGTSSTGSTGSGNTLIGAGIQLPSVLSNTVIISSGSENLNKWRIYIDETGKTSLGLNAYNNGQATAHLPTARLDVFGDLRIRNLPVSTANTHFLSTDENGYIRKQQLNMSGAPSNLVLTGNTLTLSNPLTTGNSVIVPNIYTSNGTLTDNRTVSMDNKSLIFNTSTSGRIYIGNSSPAFDTATFPTTTGNYRLYVEGGILTEKVKVALRSTSNWADYVFAPNYKLMPLNEVESFVKENKHLPGISSADALVKEGLDLGDMQARQMQKIEELTLYIIEQNKAIEELKLQNKEIRELKAQMKILIEKSK